MKINKKVMCSIVVVNIFLTTIGYVANKTVIQNELSSDIKVTTEEKSKSLEYIIEQKKNTAVNTVKWFENSDVLLKAINEKNRSDIIKFGKQAMSDFGLDYLVVTDLKGNVIARADEPNNFGDSIINEANIQKALKGEVSAGIEQGTVVKLSIRAGCPIEDEKGQIVGAVSTGYIISDKFIEDVNKTLNCDITLFNGIERVATTLKDNEKKLIGTKLNDSEIQENVLNKGQSTSKLMYIYGNYYYSMYSPLFDVDNEIIGMSFIGVPANILQSLVMKLTIYQLIISFITVLLSLLVLSFILKKYVSIPLNKVVNFFKELSNGEGDLTKTMKFTTHDEVGEVMKEFNIFILKLRKIISHVKESSSIVKNEIIGLSNRVSSCTDSMIDISNIVLKISDNMMGNAASLEETTASTHEMNKVSNMVAQSCMILSEQSIFAKEITHEGSKAIKDIITSIQNMSDSSGEVIVKINELQSLSKKINEIVTIITNISQEINLLSINASIEAARAGEHGKGFAVVAEEVRSLAEECSESSNEIINLIHEVQCNIKDTALKAETVSENINFGVNMAIIVDERFEKISGAVDIVSEKTHDIAVAAEEQAASVEQISGAMEEIANITTSTAEDSYNMNISVKHERKSMEDANVVTKRVTEIIRELNLTVDKFKTQ